MFQTLKLHIKKCVSCDKRVNNGVIIHGLKRFSVERLIPFENYFLFHVTEIFDIICLGRNCICYF